MFHIYIDKDTLADIYVNEKDKEECSQNAWYKIFKKQSYIYVNTVSKIKNDYADEIFLMESQGFLSHPEDGGPEYRIVTDRWQKFTDVCLSPETLAQLAGSCSEFLVHAVDSEGRRNGPELTLVDLLAQSPIPVTYAGGIASFEDLEELRSHGQGRVDVTVGSALDLFGGNMSYQEVLDACRKS